jgi:hypothetical protein
MSRELRWQDKLLERNCELRLRCHPSIREHGDEVVRWHWLINGHCEFDQVLVDLTMCVVLPKDELVMEENLFTIAILDKDPEGLGATM